MIAGYETTSTAVSYAIAMISQHPAVEARLLDELRSRPGQQPTQETLDQWPYTMVWVPASMHVCTVARLGGHVYYRQAPALTPPELGLCTLTNMKCTAQVCDTLVRL
jgi:cytochrome P450